MPQTANAPPLTNSANKNATTLQDENVRWKLALQLCDGLVSVLGGLEELLCRLPHPVLVLVLVGVEEVEGVL